MTGPHGDMNLLEHLLAAAKRASEAATSVPPSSR